MRLTVRWGGLRRGACLARSLHQIHASRSEQNVLFDHRCKKGGVVHRFRKHNSLRGIRRRTSVRATRQIPGGENCHAKNKKKLRLPFCSDELLWSKPLLAARGEDGHRYEFLAGGLFSEGPANEHMSKVRRCGCNVLGTYRNFLYFGEFAKKSMNSVGITKYTPTQGRRIETIRHLVCIGLRHSTDKANSIFRQKEGQELAWRFDKKFLEKDKTFGDWDELFCCGRDW